VQSSKLDCHVLSGNDITLYGDGSPIRSFCYVSDVVDGLLELRITDLHPVISATGKSILYWS
jgi:dTDP-D-glucose 4,6-dehydratase